MIGSYQNELMIYNPHIIIFLELELIIWFKGLSIRVITLIMTPKSLILYCGGINYLLSLADLTLAFFPTKN